MWETQTLGRRVVARRSICTRLQPQTVQRCGAMSLEVTNGVSSWASQINDLKERRTMVTGFHMGGESGWAQCEGPSDVGVVSTEVTSAAQASGSSFTFRCGGDRCHQYLSLSDECSHEGLGTAIGTANALRTTDLRESSTTSWRGRLDSE